MALREGAPRDDAGLLRRALDGLPAGIITIDEDAVILQCSGWALSRGPGLLPGRSLRTALEELTHVEMVDRLLIRREIATFGFEPDGTEYFWRLWGEPNPQGETSITIWETDWNGDMAERRAAFTMAASHELRGPLTALLGFSEILNMDTSNLDRDQAEAAGIIETTARHLAVLVEDVFDLTRNSFGELRLHLAEVDLRQLLSSTITALRPGVEGRDQTLLCRVDPRLPSIMGDEARIIQMLSNLINNASIHNPSRTRIEVEAGIEGDRIAISIGDDGQGLPFENPDEAFRAFRRGAGATDGDRTGSGIGLSITKRLIQLHRGDIRVESTPRRGSTFTLLFPLDHAAALARGEPGPA